MSEQNKAIVRRLLKNFGTRAICRCRQLFTPNYTHHDSSHPILARP